MRSQQLVKTFTNVFVVKGSREGFPRDWNLPWREGVSHPRNMQDARVPECPSLQTTVRSSGSTRVRC
jgi:hypothetical protein